MPRNSSLGFFGMFGRSSDLRALDAGFRAVDVHPRLVPEAVKLATASLVKEAAGTIDPPEAAFHHAAALIGYVAIGADSYAGTNGEAATEAAEARVEAALEDGDSLDARLILLALEARIVEASVVDRYDLRADKG